MNPCNSLLIKAISLDAATFPVSIRIEGRKDCVKQRVHIVSVPNVNYSFSCLVKVIEYHIVPPFNRSQSPSFLLTKQTKREASAD